MLGCRFACSLKAGLPDDETVKMWLPEGTSNSMVLLIFIYERSVLSLSFKLKPLSPSFAFSFAITINVEVSLSSKCFAAGSNLRALSLWQPAKKTIPSSASFFTVLSKNRT